MDNTYDPLGMQLLKITGVIMIIFGAVGILLYLLGLAAIIGLTYATSGIFSSSTDLIGMGLLLVGAIVELIAGILGVRTAKKPEQAGKKLIVWGILSLILSLAGMGQIALRAIATPLWELVIGMVLVVVVPATYLYAVKRIRNVPVQTEENNQ